MTLCSAATAAATLVKHYRLSSGQVVYPHPCIRTHIRNRKKIIGMMWACSSSSSFGISNSTLDKKGSEILKKKESSWPLQSPANRLLCVLCCMPWCVCASVFKLLFFFGRRSRQLSTDIALPTLAFIDSVCADFGGDST